LVTASPADQFTLADLDLLVSWCETVVMRQRAAKELELTGPVLPDGRVSPWWGIHQQAIKTLSGLAIRLRLSPQGRNPTARASKKQVKELSYYEIAAIEEEASDEAQRN
jgi:hypothetical protein